MSDPTMARTVEVRIVRGGFYLGDHLAVEGEVVLVSRSRGEYLRFLGLVEWV